MLTISDYRLRDLITATQETRDALIARIKKVGTHDPYYSLLYHDLVEADLTVHCLNELLARRLADPGSNS